MESSTERISIVMPVYNGRRYISQAVESVLAQTHTDWELLIVDDGSTDASGSIADSFAASDGRIRVIHKPNGGSASARNAGLNEATGRYLAFLDADDFWEPRLLERQLEMLKTNGIRMVYASYNRVDEEGGSTMSPVKARGKTTVRQMEWIDRIGFLTMLYDTRYERVIPFREELGSLRDDYAWLLDNMRAGGLVAFANPEILANYRLGTGVTSKKWRLLPHQYRFYRRIGGFGKLSSAFRTAYWAFVSLAKYI